MDTPPKIILAIPVINPNILTTNNFLKNDTARVSGCIVSVLCAMCCDVRDVRDAWRAWRAWQ